MNPKKFFTPEEEATIIASIQGAEKRTSGEIRVHLARECKGAPYEEAVQVFEKIGMTKTAERNGILIFMALKDHQFSVIGDIGIHEKLPPHFWDQVRDAMQESFKNGLFAQGLIQGIQVCGEQLSLFFPCRSDDQDELPNEISSH